MGRYWFFHFRLYDGNRPLPRGGITVCAREIDGGVLRMGAAICSGLDTFCKQKGREIAQRRSDLRGQRFATEVHFEFDRHRYGTISGQVRVEAKIWAHSLFNDGHRGLSMATANEVKRPKLKRKARVKAELRDVKRLIVERIENSMDELNDRRRVLEDMLTHTKGTDKPCS